MHKIAYTLPPFISLVLLLLFCNYEQWWVYLLMVAVAELILWLIMSRVSKSREYLSGYALNTQHHEEWVEQVHRTVSYTDSEGRTRTRTEVYYRHHPELWLLELNTGESCYIDKEYYDYLAQLWGTEEEYIDPPHMNCVSGGGGQLYSWNEEYKDAATHTYKGLYVNYVANSNSIFRKEEIRDEDIEKYGLIDYPKFDMSEIELDVILTSPKLPKWVNIAKDSQRAFQLINAFAGMKHEIHTFILLFDASQGVVTALKQQAYWRGGNKNEFVLCLGVDFSGIDPNRGDEESLTPQVKWCKAFSWCDAPRLESATESWFLSNRELDFARYAEWLKGNLNLWKRKEFSDFKYLGVTLSRGKQILVWSITALLCAIIVVISCVVAIDYRDTYVRRMRKDCDGYGYQLLDRYILKRGNVPNRN